MQDELKPRTVRSLFKARYLIALWACVELMSLPAAAQVAHTVMFKIEPHVVAEPIPGTPPGVSLFIVSSNAPFNVTAEGMIGELSVEVEASGVFGAQPFGSAAQLPGDATACATLLGPHEQTVYRATQKTAAKRGDGVEQAVMVTFRYHQAASPRFEFTTDDRPVLAGECAARVG